MVLKCLQRMLLICQFSLSFFVMQKTMCRASLSLRIDENGETEKNLYRGVDHMMNILGREKNITVERVHSFPSTGWNRAIGGVFAIMLVLNMNAAVQAKPLVTKDPPKDPLIEHLEFLGYQCDLVEAGIRARHLSKIHLYITYALGGIRMQTGFPGTTPDVDSVSRYRVSNAIMKELSVARLYWSDDGNLFAVAWMPGTYEKARFALFMEVWDRDTALLRQYYKKLKSFLKESAHVPQ